jgi:hypothetical protein
LEFIQRQSGAFSRALLTEMTMLWESFKPVMSGLEAEMWSSDGRGTWPPLAESTVRQKGHSTILVDTGALKASLIDPGTAMKISGTSAEWGTGIDYARYHQEGTSKMPMRQVIPDPFPADTRQQLETLQVAWIDLLAAKTWGRI